MAPGPKPITLVLSGTERETCGGLLRRRSTSQDVALRARIVLACADPQATNTPERVTHDYKRHGTTDLFVWM